MSSVISVDQVWKSFGKYSIIEDLSLEIEKGTSYGLVGLNGAGKTTMIRLLLGIFKADKGSISVLGHDPWKHEEELYRQTGVVMEHDGFWGSMTIKENLRIFSKAKGISWSETESYINEYWGKTFIFTSNKKVKYLSRGQKMQCALCRALLGRPKVCFFDEPVIALDVEAYEHFRMMVEAARLRGASMIISSHQLDAIDDLCDRVGILRDKELNDLEHPDNTGPRFWSIETAEIEKVRAIIEGSGGYHVSYHNNVWHFAVNDPDTGIPSIVKLLVDAGLQLKMVAPDESDFSTAIRRLYRSHGKFAPEQPKGTP